MSVQNGKVDQWHHAYQYDADNRITAAYTNSRTPLLSLDRPTAALSNELVENEDWENDANYYYYAHGPLARTEIGDKQLQGIDYFYNVQGWLKGTNSIVNENDLGQDGYSGVNSSFAKDVTAFSLEYFNSDYQAINSETPFASVNSSSHAASNSSALYNGNIRFMQTRLTNPTTGDAMPMLNAYKYDQLNRLLESRSYETGISSNSWNPVSYGNSYYNAFRYDGMGNILSQIRHKRDGTKIEDISYIYHTAGEKLVRNRLYHLDDVVSSEVDSTDIDDMGIFDVNLANINVNNNYSYDEEGRLIKDLQEGISKIVWRADGKVKEIQRISGSKKWIRFDYDAMGNRIAKHVYLNGGIILEKSTYYLLDAAGKQINIYEHYSINETCNFILSERNIYGYNRIGYLNESIDVISTSISQNYSEILGNKFYEISNHLGNVLTVFSNLKTSIDENIDGVVDGFKVEIISISDYSPFGVELDQRSVESSKYRYGFQKQEKDNEVKGYGNSINFEFRILDPRVGRFFSPDPLELKYPSFSPYTFCKNKVLAWKEFEGKEDIGTTSTQPYTKIFINFNQNLKPDNVSFNANGWKVINAKDIHDAKNQLINYLGENKAHIIHINAHGGVQDDFVRNEDGHRVPIPGAGWSYNPKEYYSMETHSSIRCGYGDNDWIRSNVLEWYSIETTKKIVTESDKQKIESLKEIGNKIEENGYMVFASCNTGYDTRFGENLKNLVTPTINILLNRDLTVYSSRSGVMYFKDFVGKELTSQNDVGLGWDEFNKSTSRKSFKNIKYSLSSKIEKIK